MIEGHYYRGRRPVKARGKPKVTLGRRECSETTCITVISRYNKGKYCWNHQPRKIPRLRGSPLETATRKVSCLDCLRNIGKVGDETTEVWVENVLHWKLVASSKAPMVCGVRRVDLVSQAESNI